MALVAGVVGFASLPSLAQSDPSDHSERDTFFSGFITGPDFCTATGLANGTSHTFALRAVSDYDAGPAATITAAPGYPISRPT